MAALKAAGLRCEMDNRDEKIGYKIRSAQMEKVPYMLIVGQKEEESGTVSVRSRMMGIWEARIWMFLCRKQRRKRKNKSGALRKKKGSLPGLVSGR